MKARNTFVSWLFTSSVLLVAIVLTAARANAQVVIGSWLSGNNDDGWIDWGNGFSITNSTNAGVYSFVGGAVSGYAQSLQIAEGGYHQNLAIKLEYLPGGMAAFLTNHLLTFTFSVPSAASSGSTAGYSQLYALAINATGYGFNNQATNQFSATGSTNNNNGWQPNFNFYSGAPARSQVVTVDYSSILPAITATPSSGYIELIFTFNNGGGAPTNYFINNVVLSGGSSAPPPPPSSQTVIGSWLSGNSDDGWIDWGNGFSITNSTNASVYSFVSGAVSGYAQSLQITDSGYHQNLAIKLEYLPGGMAAFLTNHLLSFTFSVPSWSGGGYSQLYELDVNASGYGFHAQSFTNMTETGNTNNNQSGMPNFYASGTVQSQVVTLNYSNILSAITATPSTGYIELIFAFNNGGGAPANYFMNNVVLSGAPSTVVPNSPPNFVQGGVSLLTGGNISLTATGAVSAPYRLWATTNLTFAPITNTWTLLGSGTVTGSPFTVTDLTAAGFPRRFYEFSSP